MGSAIIEELRGAHFFVQTAYGRLSHECVKLDIMDFKNVKDVISASKPDIIVHSANLAGGVDFCEKNPDLAKKFHFEATKFLGQEAKACGAKLIYISSECVFDGKKEAYSEEDAVRPQNVYGEYKAKSEEWIAQNVNRYIIVRTMSVFGWQPDTKTPNALMKVYFSIQKKQRVDIPVFRWGTPTYVRDLAQAIVELALSEYNGLYHVVGNSYLSRYDWLFQTAESLGWDVTYLHPVKNNSDDMIFRPLRVHLKNDKFSRQCRTKLHCLEEILPSLKKDILQK